MTAGPRPLVARSGWQPAQLRDTAEPMAQRRRLFVLYTSGSTVNEGVVPHHRRLQPLGPSFHLRLGSSDLREDDVHGARPTWVLDSPATATSSYWAALRRRHHRDYDGAPHGPSKPGAFWEVIEKHKGEPVLYRFPTAISCLS